MNLFALKNGKLELLASQGKQSFQKILYGLENAKAEGNWNFEKINFPEFQSKNKELLILASDFLDAYRADFVNTSRDLTKIFRLRLEELLITSHDEQEDKLFDVLREILASKYLLKEKDDFGFLTELKNALTKIRVSDPLKYQELIKLAYEIKWKSEKVAIRADFADRRFRSVMFLRQILFSIIGLFIAFPVFLYGFLHNGLQYQLTDKLPWDHVNVKYGRLYLEKEQNRAVIALNAMADAE
jgi:hypothetical protein